MRGLSARKRQDDIAIRVTHLGLGVRAIPLDESFIRTLASDAYRSLVAIRDSKKAQLDSVARRSGLTSLTVWLVSFSNTQQGEARFAPGDVNLTTAGRDFAPLAVIGLSPNFGDQRVRQGERMDALMAFDGAVNPNQPLSLRFETETGGDWQTVLQRVEGERSRIRSRAGGRAPLGDRPW